MPPSLSCRINPQTRALHALSLLTQLLSEAYGSTFHFDPRQTSPTGTQRRSDHNNKKIQPIANRFA